MDEQVDELDGLLRATFRAHDELTPDVAGLAAAARAGHARRATRRRQVMAVSAVGVLAAGGGTALALARHTSSAWPSATANANTATTATAPNHQSPASPPAAGTRSWSSHGLQVSVPEAWKANLTRCGTPTANTVLIGQTAMEMCLISAKPAVDVVEFGTGTSTGLSPAPSLHPTTVAGRPAQTGTEKLSDGRTATALIVPDLDVWITVKSKDSKLVARIVASAQIVDSDANGCPSRVDTVDPAGPPIRPGAPTTMVPDQPTKPIKAIVCHYSAPWSPGQPASNGPTFLANGSEIAKDQIGALTTILNTLSPGLATWQGLAGSCAPAARDGFLFRFSYASGPPVDVYLHTDNCDHMGFSNGAVTGYIPKKFVDASATFMPDMGFAAAGEAIR